MFDWFHWPNLVDNPMLRWKYWSVRIQLLASIVTIAWLAADQGTKDSILGYFGINPGFAVLVAFLGAVLTQFIQQRKLLPENQGK